MTEPGASKVQAACRVCGSGNLHVYLDQGRMPLANAYLTGPQLNDPEFREELALQVCVECGLSQLSKVVAPERMFGTYLYTSSVSATFREHCAELARTATGMVDVDDGLVLDIASNDGCLLREFHTLGCRVLGIEPAGNLAARANAEGLETLNVFWSTDLAQPFEKAKIITATNVLGHVDDVHDFVRKVSLSLAEDGAFIVEMPYILDFLKNTEFDTVYHEHLTYWSVGPLSRLLADHGLQVFDIQYFRDLHGGTIRVWAGWPGQRRLTCRVGQYLEREASVLTDPQTYAAFAARVQANKTALVELLQGLRLLERTVWAYGASAKGTTLLNACGIDSHLVERIIDDTPGKQGTYLPGNHIKVLGGINSLPRDIDYLLLTAWNFKDEIIAKCRLAGFTGQFIVPVPEPLVIA